MTTIPSRVRRLSRLLRPGRNPLARGSDRLEGMVVRLSVLLALVLVPVMLTLGSATHKNLAEQSAQQNATRNETVAVLAQDAKGVTLGANGEVVSTTSYVKARWRLPDGTLRTGVVAAPDGMRAGATMPLWLDESGTPTGEPMSTVDAMVLSVLMAGGGWTVVVGLLALACWGLHRTLDRRRYRAWAGEWTRVEPDWTEESRGA